MESILNSVDCERLYQHILKTEGEKHPLDSPERMEQCADYILAEFEHYGLETSVHEFVVDGFDYTFRNIEAIVGEGAGPELLVVSHYDTVRNAPGANDNGSAIAVMLETARVLADKTQTDRVRFVSFNLEEQNPARTFAAREIYLKHGIIDADGRFTSWHATQFISKYTKLFSKYRSGTPTFADAIAKATEEMETILQPNERELLREFQLISEGISNTSWPGRTALVGSSAWVRDAPSRGISVKGVLNLETMGYVSSQVNSQQFPDGLDTDLFKIYKTNPELTTGDFLTIIGDRNSEVLAQNLCSQCELDSVELPYACLQDDFNYEQAAHIMPDILRSDHAPFWREDIPALMLTDSANFRYPFYHTPADTIDKLDFDFLTKISKAVIATTQTF